MRIAVFSDIHSNLEALECVISDVKKNNYDKVYFLGDVLSKGPNPRECLELIMENDIKMVLGNHELYYLCGCEIDDMISDIEKEHQKWIWSQLDNKHKEYLSKCSLEINEVFDGIKISFKHFFMKEKYIEYPFYLINVLDNDIESIISSCESDLIFIGHEHREFEINCDNKKVVDVGSSGCTRDNKTHYVVVDIKDGKYNIESVELFYDREKFEKVFRESSYPEHDLIGGIFFGL